VAAPSPGPSGFSQIGGTGWADTLAGLGDRTVRRPEPRLGIGLAGVGMLMVIFGVLVWAGDAAASGVEDSGQADTTLGTILSLVLIATGVALLLRFRTGPLAAAGVVASALGVPLLAGFATFEPSRTSDVEIFTVPFSIDAIALFSIAAWLVAYLWLPHARGRTFYLGATAVFTWLYLAEKVEEGAAGYLATLPFSAFLLPFRSLGTEEELLSFPDTGSIGWVSLVVGLAYYGAAVALDRRDRQGAATAFVAVGAVVVPLAVAHLGDDLDVVGCGLLLVLIGSVLAPYAAGRGRRFTTWGWCVGIGVGVLIIAADVTEDNTAALGVTAIVLGAGVIAVAQVLTANLAEPDEMTPGPSTFRRGPKLPPGAPGAGPWGPQPPYGGGGPGYPAPGQPGYPYPGQPGYPQPPQPPPPPPPSLEPGTQF
jgi:hypothetical protein